MSVILAIDPGTTKSGVVVWNGKVLQAEMFQNDTLLAWLRERLFKDIDLCAIEMIASYGMAVGAEIFETCVWIGRFQERAYMPVERVFRRDVKLHLCGLARAKDPNVRQALIDKHGAPGTKKNQGPTYGITSHLWAALGVADYAADNLINTDK